ncbi:MAG: ATP-binding protein [Alphaproteobacteria bacterium]
MPDDINDATPSEAVDGAAVSPRSATLRGRIFLAFLCMSAITASLGTYAVLKISETSHLVAETYDKPLMAINYARAALFDFSLMDGRLGRQEQAPTPALAARQRREMARITDIFLDDLARARELSQTEHAILLADRIEGLVTAWTEKRQIANSVGMSPSLWREMDNTSAVVVELLDRLIEVSTDEGFNQRQRVLGAIKASREFTTIVTLLALMMSLIITAVLARSVTRPISIAAAAAGRIAEGDMDSVIPPTQNDETGVLLDTMRVMQHTIKETIGREIAQRKSAQGRLIAAIESSSEAVVLLDSEDRILIANRKVGNFFPRCAGRTLQGTDFSAFVRIIGTEVPSGRPAEQRLPDGRWVRSSRSATRDGGAIVFWTDISELKAREDTLRQAKKEAEAASAAKTTFLTNMSHELRTPLNAIIGFSEMIASETFGAIEQPKYKEYANDVLRSSQHLLEIINDILDVAKNEAGKLRMNLETVVVADVIDDSVHIVRDWCERAGLRLEADLPDRAITVTGDRARLRQVLLNILSNAIKFTESGGTITVTARFGDGRVSITIRDTGIGMRTQDVPTALAMFGQIDSTLARKYEGTGLGVPLAKAIVEKHHDGTLTIDSALGRGTEVTIALPLAQPEGQVSASIRRTPLEQPVSNRLSAANRARR